MEEGIRVLERESFVRDGGGQRGWSKEALRYKERRAVGQETRSSSKRGKGRWRLDKR